MGWSFLKWWVRRDFGPREEHHPRRPRRRTCGALTSHKQSRVKRGRLSHWVPWEHLRPEVSTGKIKCHAIGPQRGDHRCCAQVFKNTRRSSQPKSPALSKPWYFFPISHTSHMCNTENKMWIKIQLYLANFKLPDLHRRYGTSENTLWIPCLPPHAAPWRSSPWRDVSVLLPTSNALRGWRFSGLTATGTGQRISNQI